MARSGRFSFGWTLLTLVAAQVGLHGCLNGMRMTVPLLAVSESRGPAVIGLLMALFAAFPHVYATLFSGFLVFLKSFWVLCLYYCGCRCFA